MKTTIIDIDIIVSRSYGTKRMYLVRGYRDQGWISGFNSRFGGYNIWIKRSTR